ncbi:MAG: hypothetical protein GY780_07160 [bacterium]|nr:hypothetical protein [bacterium]
MRFVWRSIFVLLGLGLGGSAAVAAEQAPVIVSTKPDFPRQTWQLEELWRVGGENDEHIFGLMIDARCDEEGNIYLLDQQLSQVTMVSPEGHYLMELGGEGDGPGECRMPQTFALFPDGTVGLGQRFPGRFIKVNLKNEPMGNVDIGGENSAQTGYTMLTSGRYRGGTLLVSSLRQMPDETGQSRHSHLQRISDTGDVLADFANASAYLDFGKPHFSEREMVAPFIAAHSLGPDGKVYLADRRDEYSIQVWSATGRLEKSITRSFQSPKRPQRTTDRLNALFEEQDRALPFDITWDVEPHDQVIGEIIVTSDNKLVVANSSSTLDLPENIFVRYDVFDASGKWHHELDIQCEADPDQDGLIWLDDSRILLVKGLQMARLTASGNGGSVDGQEDGTEVIEIICCRVVEM